MSSSLHFLDGVKVIKQTHPSALTVTADWCYAHQTLTLHTDPQCSALTVSWFLRQQWQTQQMERKQKRKQEACLICLGKHTKIWEHKGKQLETTWQRRPDSRHCIIHHSWRGKHRSFYLLQSQSDVRTSIQKQLHLLRWFNADEGMTFRCNCILWKPIWTVCHLCFGMRQNKFMLIILLVFPASEIKFATCVLEFWFIHGSASSGFHSVVSI